MNARAPDPMACLDCGYALDAEAPAPRCPECGRPYDPADETTFSREPVPGWWGRVVRHPVVWLVGAAPLAMLLDAYVMQGRSTYAFLLLPHVTGMAWYARDCKRRRREPRTSYAIAMFAFPYGFLPVYALVTRRGPGVMVIAGALLALLGWVAAGAATIFALRFL